MDSKRKHYEAVSANISKVCRDPLSILTVITAVITFYLLMVQMKIGVPYFDVFNYLNNALYFAGIKNGSLIYLYLSPGIPLLTSLFFKIGYISVNAIFITDGIVFIIGVIGLYLLLKQRFNDIQSFAGSLIFISFPVVISWAVTGGIDIPGVSFSIWAIYLAVLGVKKDSRYLYLVLPVTMLAFLTRYTSGIILLPILLYSLINIKNIENIKKVISGISIEIIALIGIFMYFIFKLGTISPFFNLLISFTTSPSVGLGDVAYNTNTLYYIQNFLNYISLAPLQGTYTQLLNPSKGFPSILAYIITLIAFIGIILYLHKILNPERTTKLNINKFNLIKITVLIILIAGLFIALNSHSIIVSEGLLFGACYVIYSTLKNNKIKNIDLDLMVFAWFGAYLIFQSLIDIKVDRYFITMAPALAYFLILGLSEFIDKIKPKIKIKHLKSGGIYVIIALVLLSFSTATYIDHTPKKCFTVDIGDASNWLKGHDANYKNELIYSDYPPAVSWYLDKGIYGGYPRFFGNNSQKFSDVLNKNNADYYIDSLSQPKLNITGYHIIKNINGITIYEKNRS